MEIILIIDHTGKEHFIQNVSGWMYMDKGFRIKIPTETAIGLEIPHEKIIMSLSTTIIFIHIGYIEKLDVI